MVLIMGFRAQMGSWFWLGRDKGLLGSVRHNPKLLNPKPLNPKPLNPKP